jgi:threonine/homoserine/homoserine lactone efflux protein
MIPLQDLLIFAAAALLMVLTPGPNMIYLISRSICQGRKAGVTSLLGVVAGFFVHLFAAAAGLTAVFLAVPMAYEVLKWAGAVYLLWLAWQAVKPGARSPFEAQQLPPDSARKLITMGFLTSALNPKIAFFISRYFLSSSPRNTALCSRQSIVLGLTQISVSFCVNLLIALFAAGIALWFVNNPTWLAMQRYFMGFVLSALALRLMLEQKRMA